ncbi:MAG: hypothetical protein AAF654_15280, partial [Myxococcota bacterium]
HEESSMPYFRCAAFGILFLALTGCGSGQASELNEVPESLLSEPLEVRLIRADTQAVLDSNFDDGIPPLTAEDFAGRLGIAAFPKDVDVDIIHPVTLELTGPVSAASSESSPPYALFGDDRTNVFGSALVPGEYALRVRTGEYERSWNFVLQLVDDGPVDDDSGDDGLVDDEPTDEQPIDDEPVDDPVGEFPLVVHLVSGATQQPLDTDLSDGVPPLPASEFASLAIAAYPKDEPADVEGPVTLTLSGPVSKQSSEFAPPYALFGDDNTNVFGAPFAEGGYTLRVTSGQAEVLYTFTLTVLGDEDGGDNVAPPPGLYEHPMSMSAQTSDLAGWNVPADLGGFGYEMVPVTNLNASGTGSLRDAIERTDINDATTWRVIVFDVAGRINLNNVDLTIRHDKTIIAGQTAPGHVELWNTTLRVVDASDVLVMHIAARRGGPGDNWHTEDAITVRNTRRIRLQNCSFANTDDEQITIENVGSSRVTLVDNMFVFALMSPVRGDHRLGPFIRNENDKIGFYRNVMQGARRGYPRLQNSNSTSWASNLVVSTKTGPTNSPAVLDENPKFGNPKQTIFDFFGNEYIWSSTRLTNLRNDNGIEVVHYEAENVIRDGFNGQTTANLRENDSSVNYMQQPTLAPGARLIDTDQTSVRDFVLAHAGMRPSDRDATDELALTEIRTNNVALRTQPVNNPPSTRETPFVPSLDWSRSDGSGRSNLIIELDALHAALGGVTRWR